MICCSNVRSFFPSIKVSFEQVKAVDVSTREQAKSTVWFQQRVGRITASRLKLAIHTDIMQPSQSLIKSICYPESHNFKFKATSWGCEHEESARKSYIEIAKRRHNKLESSQCGLVISTSFPYMGASPDGIVNCECCGNGVVEIKCLYSLLITLFLEACDEQSFCLERCGDTYKLKKITSTIIRYKHKWRYAGVPMMTLLYGVKLVTVDKVGAIVKKANMGK